MLQVQMGRKRLNDIKTTKTDVESPGHRERMEETCAVKRWGSLSQIMSAGTHQASLDLPNQELFTRCGRPYWTGTCSAKIRPR